MGSLELPTAERIALVSLEKFKSLPEQGKPDLNQWTVLSTILQYNNNKDILKVVSLGSGTKCIGQDQLCPNGTILNDSHAEVMARRGFLRYIYTEINKIDGNIFSYDLSTKTFKLNEGISFHFFSTYPPCGDATITSCNEVSPVKNNIKPNDLTGNHNAKYFTGAKILNSTENSDRMAQNIGAIRLKPGKGVQTLSVSCSDKISRWNILGIQGALLDLLLFKPIYIDSFTFCGYVSNKSVRRAIWERWNMQNFYCKRYFLKKPEIRVCSECIEFEYNESYAKKPSPSSIVWSDVTCNPHEVAIDGKKQGVTKKKRNLLSASLNISKVKLFQQFQLVQKNETKILSKLNLVKKFKKNSFLSYGDMKNNAKLYQDAWGYIKKYVFKDWVLKSCSLLDFSTNADVS